MKQKLKVPVGYYILILVSVEAKMYLNLLERPILNKQIILGGQVPPPHRWEMAGQYLVCTLIFLNSNIPTESHHLQLPLYCCTSYSSTHPIPTMWAKAQ